MNRQIANPDFSSPILEDHPLAAEGVVAIASGVPCLGVLCCPSTVRRPLVSTALLAATAGVISSGINAVECMSITGGMPHIFDERLDGVSPTETHEPTNAAVEAIVVASVIMTPRNHALPDSVLTKPGQSVFSIWDTMTCSSDIPNKVVGSNEPRGTARFAYASPMKSPAAPFFGDDAESSYDIARLNVSSAEASVSSSHSGTLLSRVALWLEPTGVSAPVRLASFYGRDCDTTNSGAVK